MLRPTGSSESSAATPAAWDGSGDSSLRTDGGDAGGDADEQSTQLDDVAVLHAKVDHHSPSVAIILPAFNEEQTIEPTIRAFHASLPEAEIVVVNNNSTDRTADLAKATFRSLGCRAILVDEPRRGKGNAVRRAFHDVDADIYVLADADMTYPANRVRDLIEPVAANQADMVVGDRLAGGDYQRQNRRPFHDLGNRLVLYIVNLLFRSNLSDIMSGYRVFSADFVWGYPILVDGFEIETDMTLHALDKRFRIVEIPVEYVDRPAGSSSKLNTFSDGLRVLRTISSLARHYRPMLFFGSIAFSLFVLGLLCGLPVLGEWIAFQYIYRVPLAILATGLMVLSAGAVGIGLVLDSVVHQERLRYERDFLMNRRSPRRQRSRD
jgi:hypothetical protein